MAVNWNEVAANALKAVEASLGASLSVIAPAAQHSVITLSQTAAAIAADPSLTDSDRQLLAKNQQRALENVLLGYQAIGIAAAERAVAAAWAVVGAALETAVGLPA
jgi:hypothetical protein